MSHYLFRPFASTRIAFALTFSGLSFVFVFFLVLAVFLLALFSVLVPGTALGAVPPHSMLSNARVVCRVLNVVHGFLGGLGLLTLLRSEREFFEVL